MRRAGKPVLVQFEGRQPTLFIDTQGRVVNNINVTHALRPFPIAQFSLHQSADKSLQLKMRGVGLDEQAVRKAVLDLFGADQSLTVAELNDDDAREGKVIQYTTDIEDVRLAQAEFSFQRATAMP